MPYSKYFIFLGAIQPRKNIDTLIDAFEKLRKDGRSRDVGLVIAGEPGWMYDEIMKKIKNSERVTATGKIFPEDSPALLAGSVAFVLPSFYEGFGLPALEAMACGVPIVAADNSSLAEIVGEAGILFDAYSRDNLADCLLKILESDKLKYSLAGQALARACEFTWKKCAAETLACFEF